MLKNILSLARVEGNETFSYELDSSYLRRRVEYEGNYAQKVNQELPQKTSWYEMESEGKRP